MSAILGQAGAGTAGAQRRGHVTRTRNEQPRSAGVPTPLPKISTLMVLPRPPGMSSVFSARRRLQDRRASIAGRAEAEQEVGLIEEAERRQARGFGRRADAREVDVGRDVLLAGHAEPGRRVRRTLGPAIVCRANVVSVPPAWVAE